MVDRPPPPLPPPPRPWTPPSSPLATLGDAHVLALKVAASVLLVVVVAVGLLFYARAEDGADLDELRELAAGGGVAETVSDDAPASLWVNADPIGSTVLVDGDSVGTTPLWVESIPAGELWVQVIGFDGTVIDTTISVASGAMAELDLTARPLVASLDDDGEPAADPVEITEAPPPPRREPRDERPREAPARASTGDLRVTSSPSGAVVLLDGRRVGTTPLSIDELRPGRRSVSVMRGGYETSVRRINVRAGVELEASFALRPQQEVAEALPPAERPVERPPPAPRPQPEPAPPAQPQASAVGTVEILVRPWGRIVIDGTTHQREADNVYRTTLSVGTHRVVVTHPVLGSDERTINVLPGGLSRIEFDLARGSGGE